MNSIKDLLIDSNSDKQSGHRYGFIYDLLFTKVFAQKGSKLRVLEIGVSKYGDGSLKAYAGSDMVEHAVGIDIVPYYGNLTEKMSFYELDAYKKETVVQLRDIEASFDIIIDDGTHDFNHQMFFFKHYEDLLSTNGLLVCEDVTRLELINVMNKDETCFFFDGWANRGIKVNSARDKNLYAHNERIIVKSKSEKLNDFKVHDNKPHIPRLPVVEFKDYEWSSTELSISLPLFHPETDTYDRDKFQKTHCKGAVWAAMSMLHNTDLSDNGVPFRFHIEDKVWEDAMPVFRDFGVPDRFCKKMTFPKLEKPRVSGKPQYGKTLMALIDDEMPDTDILMIIDSDYFACTTGDKLKIYHKLILPLLKQTPSVSYFKRQDFRYLQWISVSTISAGMPPNLVSTTPLNELEKQAYEILGFERELEPNTSPDAIVNRTFADDYITTFPRGHALRDFAKKHMTYCYTPSYAYAIWAEYNHPLIDLDSVLQIPIYDWEGKYIEARRGLDCFAHFRVEKCVSKNLTMPSRMHEYWDTFFENLSRHVVG